MKSKDIVLNLIKSINSALDKNRFCNNCKYYKPRVIDEKCLDCIAGIPLNFNFKEKK